ncbi:hypothetical protein CPAR01_00635 [Colletotrichum paranaense]|uniref:Major facilitator superfamily (MFS) profile domain-containing protein n=1 Tax=Colletotrichum paranaense TaxID=1914294 RepID=A0ABQ9T4F1_9PEZI|nr:uncharacterized protein CPAR01_00635 [Colletotrichum paranaense]KAK1546668.1 hypothetical protein CPAR01_00635 [Colletotrichum paranaense]
MPSFKESGLYRYVAGIKGLPAGILNRQLLMTTFVFALAGMPKVISSLTHFCANAGWDEGSASAITQLPSFLSEYPVNSTLGSESNTISNLVSFVNIGAGVGALMSFLINDRFGRRQSLRIYQAVYVIGSLISCFSYGNLAALYVGRIVAGLGIGACTVVGPMTIAEIAPKTVRGLMTLWFNVAMLSGQMVGVFVVYGCSRNISSAISLEYQVPWFVQTFAPAISFIGSFFVVESPRWLAILGQPQQALESLIKLRGLPGNHPYVEEEYTHLLNSIEDESIEFGDKGVMSVVKETFLVRSNLRRLQLVVIAYILAQFSGANSVTNYLPTIFGLVGIKAADSKVLTSGIYALVKLICTIMASLVFVDLLGRRKSLMIGITIQMICHSYLAGYLNFEQRDGYMPEGASKFAIVVIYIHAIGWAIGLYTLPYLFGAELWPNRIRSFGGALSQSFHWFLYFAITKATPSILSSFKIWGAFVFFVGWCLVALVYTFFCVPETSSLSLDDMNLIFQRSTLKMRQPLPSQHTDVEGTHLDEKRPSLDFR